MTLAHPHQAARDPSPLWGVITTKVIPRAVDITLPCQLHTDSFNHWHVEGIGVVLHDW